MEFRIYDHVYGPDNIIDELRQMLRSNNDGAKRAAARFFVAMTQMERDDRLYGNTVPYNLINGLSFTPRAALWVRSSEGHHLYFTFIARPTAPQGEARMLLIAADVSPSAVSADTSAKRHNAMP